MASPPKRKLRNLLVDSGFQLKYTGFILIVSLSIFAVLGFMLVREYEASRTLMNEVNPLIEGDSQDFAERQQGEIPAEYMAGFDSIMDEVQERDDHVALWLLLFVGILVLLLAGAGIWLTHKVAGPLVALTRFMKAVTLGDWQVIRPFRKGDAFKGDLDRQFQQMVQAIQDRARDELVVLQQLEEQWPDAPTPEFQQLIKEKRTYLEGS